MVKIPTALCAILPDYRGWCQQLFFFIFCIFCIDARLSACYNQRYRQQQGGSMTHPIPYQIKLYRAAKAHDKLTQQLESFLNQ